MEKQIIDRNSMKYWFPKVKDLGIPVPKTILLDVPVKDEEILEAAQEFQFPIFIRTYHAAAKHEWKETCYVKKRKRLIQQVKQMSMVNWHLPDDGIALREFLPLNYQFKAFNEMPVAKERRYFIKDGGIQCHHPYWPEESIQFYSIEKPERWREQLAVLNTETDDEKVQLERMAKKVAQVVDGYWSVDFAQRNNGVWYLIDMAKGEDSFHWLDCPHCPEEQQERYGHSGKKEQSILGELTKKREVEDERKQ
mgnify:FL=1